MSEAGEPLGDHFFAVFWGGWWMGVFAGGFEEKLVQNVVFLW
jgi:hypothetical protein